MKGWNPWLAGFIALVCLTIVMLSIYGATKIILYQHPSPSIEPSEEELVKEVKKVETIKEEGITVPYRIAIVIDDMGYNMDRARELLDMDIPISFAILPFLPHSTDIAREASIKKRDVLLHIPMEPKRYPEEDPGEGSLLTSMSDEEILIQLIKDLDAVPFITGVNNHMGSKFSENSHKMSIVLTVIKTKELYFLDSKTTPDTTGYKLAVEMGLQALDRQVFLDNDQDVEYTLKQFEELIKIAKEKGSAIAIGHPHSTTIAALKEVIDKFEEEGIEVVPVSSLLD
ncbi:MAG: divergent polysaccharide deacetylase family protein [Thermodesulfobacteriota bacterium]